MLVGYLSRKNSCSVKIVMLINCVTLCLVEESFDNYVAKESLDGENKYDAGDHGFQVRLLVIHLMCFSRLSIHFALSVSLPNLNCQ